MSVKLTAAFLLLLLGLIVVQAAPPPPNLLCNGDFENGLANWQGEFRLLDLGDRNFTGVDLGRGAPGVVADLAPGASTVTDSGSNCCGLYQSFRCSGGKLDFSITYQLSDDYLRSDILSETAGDSQSVVVHVLSPTGYLSRLMPVWPKNTSGLPCRVPSMVGPEFSIVIYDVASGWLGGSSVQPTVGTIKVQTSRGTLNVPEGSDKVFFIIFKKGTGRVALYSVKISNSETPTAQAPLTDKSATVPQMHLGDPGDIPTHL